MINVAVLGFGVVGSGTVEVLTQNKALIEKKVGDSVNIKYILDLRDFPDSPFGSLVVHDFNVILNDPEVSIVAEMMGGSHPAYDFTKACLLAGKSVVTSNKEVVANFGVELLELAAENGASYLFEASVGGGIPIIRPINNDLSSNQIISVSGILNGTTNYILTKMESEGADFESVLKDAQRKGYAEANPAADVEGLDAARKIVILAAMSFGKRIAPSAIHCEGITSITLDDIKLARKMGYAIKLIGYTEKLGDKVLAMVSPRLVPTSNPIGGINDVFNGILVDADMVGEVMFYGPGAGKLPTASAVVADMIDIMAHTPTGIKAPVWTDADASDIAELDEYSCANLFVFDAPLSELGEINKLISATAVYSDNGRTALISSSMTEKEARELIATTTLPLVTRIRVL
ncbi:MAG: homoserine dehydrogenase [Ruminococcaceae bacterium]|nr:homoserine dehydrogenase [Oscillospiraceae bacterium]